MKQKLPRVQQLIQDPEQCQDSRRHQIDEAEEECEVEIPLFGVMQDEVIDMIFVIVFLQ